MGLTKYLVVMYKHDKTESKDIYAADPSTAINRADPQRRFKKYVVYEDGKEVKTRTRF